VTEGWRREKRVFSTSTQPGWRRIAAQCSSNGAALRRDHAAAPCATDRPISGTREREINCPAKRENGGSPFVPGREFDADEPRVLASLRSGPRERSRARNRDDRGCTFAISTRVAGAVFGPRGSSRFPDRADRGLAIAARKIAHDDRKKGARANDAGISSHDACSVRISKCLTRPKVSMGVCRQDPRYPPHCDRGSRGSFASKNKSESIRIRFP